MPRKSPARYIPVDELGEQLQGIEQLAAYYGIALPELHRTTKEVRTACFLACGREEETGDRALAIREGPPLKFRCHQYGCGRGGGLIALMDLMKPGEHADGRPRGARFKELARDLQAIVTGAGDEPSSPIRDRQPSESEQTEEVVVNLPLAASPNERARALVELDRQFVTDPAQMPPAAAKYFRARPFLTPEVCRQWRVGYLPLDAKTMLRGKIVYGYVNEAGEVLTWFARDPRFEERHLAWRRGGKEGREPIKTQFVNGFHRGLELYGACAVRTREVPDDGARSDLVVVEGPNDAIRLQALGAQAVALCSNTITTEQAAKAALLARDMPGGSGIVTLMLDCDEEGVSGTVQALPLLAEHAPVRLAWNRTMHDGQFWGRQPESLSLDEWGAISKK